MCPTRVIQNRSLQSCFLHTAGLVFTVIILELVRIGMHCCTHLETSHHCFLYNQFWSDQNLQLCTTTVCHAFFSRIGYSSGRICQKSLVILGVETFPIAIKQEIIDILQLSYTKHLRLSYFPGKSLLNLQ